MFKESIVTLILLSLALFYSYSEIFLWKVPGPNDFLVKLFDPLGEMVFGK
jgi:hypothetical protein